MGVTPKDLAPPDRIPLYQNVIATVVTPASQGAVLLIGADSERYSLLISSSAAALVGPFPDISAGGKGITLSVGIPLMLTIDDWGPLVTSAWYCIGGTVTITAIPVSMRDWPSARKIVRKQYDKPPRLIDYHWPKNRSIPDATSK